VFPDRAELPIGDTRPDVGVPKQVLKNILTNRSGGCLFQAYLNLEEQ
jgi:hypothetical protein